MFKKLIRTLSQKILGYDTYLFIFSLVTLKRIQLGFHEKEFRYFLTLIPNRGTVLDIGANIGIMSVLLAKKSDQISVYSFEPIPDNLKAMKRLVRVYSLKNIQVIASAVGEDQGNLAMVVPEIMHAKMHGLSRVISDQPNAIQEMGNPISVPVLSLDNFEPLRKINEIVAVKIDVENFEYYVLKGGIQIIEKHKPIILCELWDDANRPLCFALMEKMGYCIKVYQDGNLVAFNGQDRMNFFFLPSIKNN